MVSAVYTYQVDKVRIWHSTAAPICFSALRLGPLQDFKFVGDVRGVGMMVGLDIVDNGVSKRQAPAAAKWIREALKARRVLVSTDGPFSSIIKLKPPLCFGKLEADQLLRELQLVRF